MSKSLLQLLGVSNDATLNDQFRKCKEQIKSLKGTINALMGSKDEEMLLKFNSSSDDHKHAENVPKSQYQFPMKEPNADGSPAKGSAKFRCQRTLSGHRNKVNAIKWSSDSTSLVSASLDGSLIVWNALTGNSTLGIPLRMGWVMSVDFSPNGKYIASGGL